MVSKYFFAVCTFLQFINFFSFMDRALVSWLKNRMNGENSIDIYTLLLLLLLLSRFSCVRLCVTPWTAAHQAPLSLGFYRQEHWSGLPFPSLVQESEKCKCLTPSDPMDCSLPGSSIHGIFLARVLEWGAIAFSVSKARMC